MVSTTSPTARSAALASLFAIVILGMTGCGMSGRGEPLLPGIEAGGEAPEIAWTYESGRGVEVNPLVVGPDIFVASTDRRLHQLETSTGKRVWRKRLEGPLAGLPMVRGDSLFAATGRPDGSVYTVDLARRKVNWRRPVGDAAGGAVYFQGTILLATREGQVFGLSPSDGRSIWVTNLEAPIWGYPVFDSTRALLLLPARNGKLFAVDARSGEKRWVAELERPLAGVAVSADGIAAVSIKGDISFLDGLNGNVLWTSLAKTTVSSPPVIAGDLVIVAGLDGTVTAFRRGNGSPAWKKSLGGPFRSEPAVRGDRMVAAAASGQVWLLDRLTGEVLGSTRHPQTIIVSPVPTSTGWVVAGEHGLLVAYRWGGDT